MKTVRMYLFVAFLLYKFKHRIYGFNYNEIVL